MSALAWVGGSAGAVVVLGAYLRWAAAPVTAAYRLGRAMGRMR